MSKNGNGNGNGNGDNRASWGKISSRLVDPSGRMNDEPVLPGWDGVPFRGPVPNLKEGDPLHRQPQQAAKVHVDILDLSDKQQLKRYEEICQLVVNGFAQLSYEERAYDKAKKSWRILVRWWELYAYVPEAVTRGHMYGRPG